MARVRMVTRTVELVKVKALQIDINTARVSIEEYTLTGTYTDNDSILKYLNKIVEPNIKVVKVESKINETALYGMSEADFLQYATLLPPRGSRADDTYEIDEVTE